MNLIVAAVLRAVGLGTPMLHATFILVWLIPIFIAMIHDYVSERVGHPIYLAGAGVLIVSTFRDNITTTDAWSDFTL